MDLDWTDFPDAPQAGAFLCELGEIPHKGVLSKTLNGFPFLVVLAKGAPLAFVNACPHQFLPLDQRSEKILSADGLHFLCSNHAASFRIKDGQGTEGEGIGCQLAAIPATLRGTQIFIAI